VNEVVLVVFSCKVVVLVLVLVLVLLQKKGKEEKKLSERAENKKPQITPFHTNTRKTIYVKKRINGGTSSRSGRLFDRPNGRLRVNKRSVNRVRLRRHLDRSLLGSDFIQQVHLIVFRVPVPDFFNHDTHVFLLVYGVFNHSSV
tara:strand:+ start:94 stop:525 length:432 start_codon:yes stop_codon:yes gene_type:complete